MACLLPCHETAFFGRATQLLRLEGTPFEFLVRGVQRTGSPLPRAVLAAQCAKDPALLQFLCKATKSSRDKHSRTATLFSATVGAMLSLPGQPDRASVAAIVPTVLACMQARSSPDHAAAGLITAAQLASVTGLSQAVLQSLITAATGALRLSDVAFNTVLVALSSIVHSQAIHLDSSTTGECAPLSDCGGPALRLPSKSLLELASHADLSSALADLQRHADLASLIRALVHSLALLIPSLDDPRQVQQAGDALASLSETASLPVASGSALVWRLLQTSSDVLGTAGVTERDRKLSVLARAVASACARDSRAVDSGLARMKELPIASQKWAAEVLRGTEHTPVIIVTPGADASDLEVPLTVALRHADVSVRARAFAAATQVVAAVFSETSSVASTVPEVDLDDEDEALFAASSSSSAAAASSDHMRTVWLVRDSCMQSLCSKDPILIRAAVQCCEGMLRAAMPQPNHVEAVVGASSPSSIVPALLSLMGSVRSAAKDCAALPLSTDDSDAAIRACIDFVCRQWALASLEYASTPTLQTSCAEAVVSMLFEHLPWGKSPAREPALFTVKAAAECPLQHPLLQRLELPSAPEDADHTILPFALASGAIDSLMQHKDSTALGLVVRCAASKSPCGQRGRWLALLTLDAAVGIALHHITALAQPTDENNAMFSELLLESAHCWRDAWADTVQAPLPAEAWNVLNHRKEVFVPAAALLKPGDDDAFRNRIASDLCGQHSASSTVVARAVLAGSALSRLSTLAMILGLGPVATPAALLFRPLGFVISTADTHNVAYPPPDSLCSQVLSVLYRIGTLSLSAPGAVSPLARALLQATLTPTEGGPERARPHALGFLSACMTAGKALSSDAAARAATTATSFLKGLAALVKAHVPEPANIPSLAGPLLLLIPTAIAGMLHAASAVREASAEFAGTLGSLFKLVLVPTSSDSLLSPPEPIERVATHLWEELGHLSGSDDPCAWVDSLSLEAAFLLVVVMDTAGEHQPAIGGDSRRAAAILSSTLGAAARSAVEEQHRATLLRLAELRASHRLAAAATASATATAAVDLLSSSSSKSAARRARRKRHMAATAVNEAEEDEDSTQVTAALWAAALSTAVPSPSWEAAKWLAQCTVNHSDSSESCAALAMQALASCSSVVPSASLTAVRSIARTLSRRARIVGGLPQSLVREHALCLALLRSAISDAVQSKSVLDEMVALDSSVSKEFSGVKTAVESVAQEGTGMLLEQLSIAPSDIRSYSNGAFPHTAVSVVVTPTMSALIRALAPAASSSSSTAPEQERSAGKDGDPGGIIAVTAEDAVADASVRLRAAAAACGVSSDEASLLGPVVHAVSSPQVWELLRAFAPRGSRSAPDLTGCYAITLSVPRPGLDASLAASLTRGLLQLSRRGPPTAASLAREGLSAVPDILGSDLLRFLHATGVLTPMGDSSSAQLSMGDSFLLPRVFLEAVDRSAAGTPSRKLQSAPLANPQVVLFFAMSQDLALARYISVVTVVAEVVVARLGRRSGDGKRSLELEGPSTLMGPLFHCLRCVAVALEIKSEGHVHDSGVEYALEALLNALRALISLVPSRDSHPALAAMDPDLVAFVLQLAHSPPTQGAAVSLLAEMARLRPKEVLRKLLPVLLLLSSSLQQSSSSSSSSSSAVDRARVDDASSFILTQQLVEAIVPIVLEQEELSVGELFRVFVACSSVIPEHRRVGFFSSLITSAPAKDSHANLPTESRLASLISLLVSHHVLPRTAEFSTLHAADSVHPKAMTDALSLYPSHASHTERLSAWGFREDSSGSSLVNPAALSRQRAQSTGPAGASLTDGMELSPTLDLCRTLIHRFSPREQVDTASLMVVAAQTLLDYGEGADVADLLEPLREDGNSAVLAFLPSLFHSAPLYGADGSSLAGRHHSDSALVSSAQAGLADGSDAHAGFRLMTHTEARAVAVSLLRAAATHLGARAFLRPAVSIKATASAGLVLQTSFLRICQNLLMLLERASVLEAAGAAEARRLREDLESAEAEVTKARRWRKQLAKGIAGTPLPLGAADAASGAVALKASVSEMEKALRPIQHAVSNAVKVERFWESISKTAHSLLDRVALLLTTEGLVAVVEELALRPSTDEEDETEAADVSIRRRGLLLLGSQVAARAPTMAEEDIHVLGGIIPGLVRTVSDASQPIVARQAAVGGIHAVGVHLGRAIPDAFVDAVECLLHTVEDLLSRVSLSNVEEAMLVSTIGALRDLCEPLGAKFVPWVLRLAAACLRVAESRASAFNVTRDKGEEKQSQLSVAVAVEALGSLAQTLPQFLSAVMDRILRLAMHPVFAQRLPEEASYLTRTVSAMEEALKDIATGASSRAVLPKAIEAVPAAMGMVKDSPVGARAPIILSRTLETSVSKGKRSEVVRSRAEILRAALQLAEYRWSQGPLGETSPSGETSCWPLRDASPVSEEDVDAVEESLCSLFKALVLRLSEEHLRGVVSELHAWASEDTGMLGAAASVRLGPVWASSSREHKLAVAHFVGLARRLASWRVVQALTETLGDLFVPQFGMLLDDAVSELQSLTQLALQGDVTSSPSRSKKPKLLVSPAQRQQDDDDEDDDDDDVDDEESGDSEDEEHVGATMDDAALSPSWASRVQQEAPTTLSTTLALCSSHGTSPHRLRVRLLQALTLCVKYDRSRFLTPARVASIVQALASCVEAPATTMDSADVTSSLMAVRSQLLGSSSASSSSRNKRAREEAGVDLSSSTLVRAIRSLVGIPGGREGHSEFCKDALAEAVKAITASTPIDDGGWKKLIHTAAMLSRSSRPTVRVGGLVLTGAVFSGGSEDALSLLPEALPALRECLSDRDEEVENEAAALATQLEALSGEELAEYLR
jgi:hypothetical protein